jgi:calmodulin
MNSALQRDELAEAFAFFDKNGDGHISKEELKMVLLQLGENLGEEEIEEIFKEADLNNDGIIDYHEFITIFNK